MVAPKPEISVIIANWNGRHWLQTCLPSLKAQTYTDFEIIIVDNGSEDGSVAWLAAHWPQVRVLPQSHNLGFAQANNIGIRASRSPFILTLNNDTLAAPDFLAEMRTAVTIQNIGMVAACLLNWQYPNRLDSAGIEVDGAGIAWQRGWNLPAAAADLPADVFGPSAAAALYRRAMLERIGLFDEDYFAYYEDVDLAWRARQAGWRCRYAPAAQVKHWHSATAANIPARKLYLMSRNKIWTLLKNVADDRLWRTLPVILAYDLLATVYQTVRTRQGSALRGRLDALRNRQVALGKRPSFVPPVPLSPVTPPWRLSARTRTLPPT